MRATTVATIFLALLCHHCVENLFNFPRIIEETLRDIRRKTGHTDESYFKQSPLLAEYDFIVVGAGPGGSVVANRLSENPEWKVLLLEAGKEESILGDIPIFVSYMQFTDYNWGFKSEPQPGACLGMDDQQCRWPRGKGLGGTSLINYMIYTRGNKPDYDMWAEQGNIGWSFNEVWPYFLKSEDMRIQELVNSTSHRRGGYLPVEYLGHKTKLGAAFLEAGKEMGYKIIDYNTGEPPHGFSPVQETMNHGHRASSAKAFLRPVKNRPNLHISSKSRVMKVHINPVTKTAESVEVARNRLSYTIKARKEIILSAGSLGSPQILMLSGVGPKSHLEELGIQVIQDLPVGENLQEHVAYCGLTFLTNESYTGILEDRLFDPKWAYDFFEKGTGPLSIPGAVEGLAYISTKHNDDKRGRPDMEIIFASGSLTADNGRTVRGGIGVKNDIYEETFRPIEGRDSWTTWPMMLHPKSKGYMRLKSKNPWHWPKFYANYFQNEQDLDTIVEGIKFSIEMSKTAAFQKYGSYLNHLPIKPCLSSPQGSDEYWRCAVRHLTTTLHHQSGTCKMGPASDPTAVVSPELKVHGINNLRVIDSSVIPQLVTAHTVAPTYMIGEKGSDMIKATWSSSNSEPPSSSNSGYPSPVQQGNVPTVGVPVQGPQPMQPPVIVPVPLPEENEISNNYYESNGRPVNNNAGTTVDPTNTNYGEQTGLNSASNNNFNYGSQIKHGGPNGNRLSEESNII